MNNATTKPASPTREPSWVLLAVIAVCPFIAMSDTVVDAFGISLAMIVMVLIASSLMTLIGKLIPDQTRWIAAVLIVSCTAAAVAIGFDAWLHDLHDRLHVFLAMLICNPVLLADIGFRSDRPAHPIRQSFVRSLLAAWILIGLSIGRELVGRGSLLHDSSALIGRQVSELIAFRSDMGFLLAMLAPGAFFAIGIAFALYQRLARTDQE